MLYVIFEEREVGCSCSLVSVNELRTILVKNGKPLDLFSLRIEYGEKINEINVNAYVKRRKLGSFSEWLVREKGFKEIEYKSISL